MVEDAANDVFQGAHLILADDARRVGRVIVTRVTLERRRCQRDQRISVKAHLAAMAALNLRSPDLTEAYNAVLSGDPNTNWALFSYSGNDLKVSGTGNGGLEELEEEFSDGRIQYAFVRVVHPTVRFHDQHIPYLQLTIWSSQSSTSSFKLTG